VFQANQLLLNERFFKQGLDILLVRWDEARGIKRDEIYRYFFTYPKAQTVESAITFEQGLLLHSKVQQYIADYFTLSTAQTAEILQLNGEAVLKSIRHSMDCWWSEDGKFTRSRI